MLLLLALVPLRIVDPAPLEEIRLRTFDFYQSLRPRETVSRPVVIVDIDEASLKDIGQWPWPRTIVADLVTQLTQLGAAAIAFLLTFTATAPIGARKPSIFVAGGSGGARNMGPAGTMTCRESVCAAAGAAAAIPPARQPITRASREPVRIRPPLLETTGARRQTDYSSSRHLRGGTLCGCFQELPERAL